MLALAELEALAARYRRERARRLSAPRAAVVRDQLAKAWRALRLAADTVGELDRYACAAAGMELVDLHGVRPWCTDQRDGCLDPSSRLVHAMRTDSGRPSSSMRFRARTAMATSVA